MPLGDTDKLIILDRDGVINVMRESPINDPDDWMPIPGSMDAIALLTQAGYMVAVAENMSGIDGGTITMEQLNEIHGKMHTHIQQAGGYLVGIWFCPHRASSECDCRKPNSGMIDDIIDRLRIKPLNTYLVGDGLKDVQAIAKVGGIPILVLTGKGKHTLSMETLPEETQVFDDLLAFSKDRIIQDAKNNGKGGAV